MAAFAAGALALFLVACLNYVLFTYAMAFAGSKPRPERLWRAAAVELLATLALLPLWPLWTVVGATYRAAVEGEGKARPGRHPVLLLHGLAMNRTYWLFVGRRLAARGIGPLYGFTYFSPQSVRRSARHLGRMVERVLACEDAERVDIVAHSLGGLVARYYIERLGGGARVGQLVTIASPHRGTALGRFGLGAAAKELLAGSHLLDELGPPPAGARYTSVWSRADALIVPADSCSLVPYGEDRVFNDLGHLSLLLSPRVVEVVAERLTEATH